MKSCAPYWGLLVFQTMKRRPCWCYKPFLFNLNFFLWATRGAHNPNLQVVTTHASLVARMYPAFVWTSSKSVQNVSCSRAFGPSITRNLITRVLIICHVKLTQSTTLELKRFDLGWLLSALRRNLWLLLVLFKLCFVPINLHSCWPRDMSQNALRDVWYKCHPSNKRLAYN